jgi:ABC-type transporter Mla subunit MlaD
MADLDPVTQKFIADVSDYIRHLQEATDETRHFAEQVQEATRDLLAMAAAADVAAKEIDKLRGKMNDANLTDAKTADELAQVRTRLDEVKGAGDQVHGSTTRVTEDIKAAGDQASKLHEKLKTATEDMRHTSEATDRATERFSHFREMVGSVVERIGTMHTAIVGFFTHTDEEAQKAEGSSGVGGFFSNFGRGGKFWQSIVGFVGESEEGEASLSALTGSLGAFGAGALVIAPAIIGLVTWVGALATGFLAAGAGIGAFALLAKPAFEKVTKALGDNRKELAKLDPAERGAVLGIRHLKDAYEAMSKAFEPDAFKVLNDGLKIANELLPQIKPFADTAATALDKVLKQLDKFFAPRPKAPDLPQGILKGNKIEAPPLTGWQEFAKFLHTLEGPSIQAIARGIGRVAGAVAQLMESFSKKDVIHAINILFDILAGVINRTAYAIRNVMNMWDDLSAAFKNTKQWISDALAWIKKLGSESKQQIEQAAHSIEHQWDNLWSFTVKEWRLIGEAIEAAWRFISTVANAGMNHVGAIMISFGHRVEAIWDAAWNAVVRVARSVPGRIVAALAALPGMLFGAGARAIESLARGMLSAIGSVISAASGIASKIAGFFGLSPAKWGELSGSGAPEVRGRHFAQDMARGILQGAPQVHAAVNSLAGVMGGRTSTLALATTQIAPQLHVQVPIAMAPGMGSLTSPQFLQGIQPVVQEAILRYVQLNQGNGLFAYGRRS